MSKPTLQQIFDFGLTRVNREREIIIDGKEFTLIRQSKRYPKEAMIYISHIFYNYPVKEISNFLQTSKSCINSQIYRVKNSESRQNKADELLQSLKHLK